MRNLWLVLCLAPLLHAQNPNSAVYPAGTAADSDLFVATNRASTTLNGSITNVATSIVLTSGAAFIAPVIVTIESEIIHCTTLTTNTLSGCTRGLEGTSGAAHSSGIAVFGLLTAWHHNQVAAEIKAIEAHTPAATHTVTFSATPTFAASSTTEDDFYLSTALSANVTSSTLSGATDGELLFFEFQQASSGGPYTVAMPTGFSQACAVSPIASAKTKMAFKWKAGSTTAELISCTADSGPTIFGSEQAAPGTPASGQFYCWADSTDHAGIECKANNSSTVYKMLASGTACTSSFGCLIQTQTLGSAASTVTFSSIPGTYTHLKLVFDARCSVAAATEPVYMQVNGDTAANYSRQYSVINQASVATGQTLSSAQGAGIADVVCASGFANGSASGEITFPNYVGTSFLKKARIQSSTWTTSGQSSFYLYDITWYWASTSAITSITLGMSAGGGNFVANSVFSLYGIN